MARTPKLKISGDLLTISQLPEAWCCTFDLFTFNEDRAPMRDMKRLAARFDATYQEDWAAEASSQLWNFRKRFPLEKMKSLTLKSYAIGQNKGETYCHWLETGTRAVAGISGTPSTKFGVYYGTSKTDKIRRFRYTKKYSEGLPDRGEEKAAFRTIKRHLLALLAAGKSMNFSEIDENPLAQMLKAKVLCLHFPDKFLAICDEKLLLKLADALDLDTDSCSEIQYRALLYQDQLPEASQWSSFKYTDFLYTSVLGTTNKVAEAAKKRAMKKPRKPDFDKLMELWRKVGKESEAIAWRYEKNRLQKAGLHTLVRQMEDVTDTPSRGYDFLSFSDYETRRFIEVKTFTKVGRNDHRIFLSRNEKSVSESADFKDDYYFYLVRWGEGEEAKRSKEVIVMHASEFYRKASLTPETYQARLSN